MKPLSLSFGQQVDRLDSLVYIENIVNTLIIEHTESNKQNYHLNRFLSASAWSSLRHLQITSQISIGLALQLVLTKVIARAMSVFFLPGQ